MDLLFDADEVTDGCTEEVLFDLPQVDEAIDQAEEAPEEPTCLCPPVCPQHPKKGRKIFVVEPEGIGKRGRRPRDSYQSARLRRQSDPERLALLQVQKAGKVRRVRALRREIATVDAYGHSVTAREVLVEADLEEDEGAARVLRAFIEDNHLAPTEEWDGEVHVCEGGAEV